jgi:hypothetical protein
MPGSAGVLVAVACICCVLIVVAPGSLAASQDAQVSMPAQLIAGGKVFLKNDLQAWSDSMLLFRRFRNEFERIDRFERVDDEEEADLVAILSADPNVVGQNDIVNRGIPYPSGYGTSKVMFLVVFTAGDRELLWMDAEPWDTSRSVTSVDSHQKLVRRLKAALDQAGGGGNG